MTNLMQEIQPKDLQPGKVYFIESTMTFSGLKATSNQKAFFCRIVTIHDIYDMDYAYFDKVTNIRASDYTSCRAVNLEGREVPLGYPTDHYRFYLCEADVAFSQARDRLMMDLTKVSFEP